MINFDSKGQVKPEAVIFDRDGYLKDSVKTEIDSVDISEYSSTSDIVIYYYVSKLSATFNNISDHTILARILKNQK